MLSQILAILLQIGPNPSAEGPSAVPPELAEQRRRAREAEAQRTRIASSDAGLSTCLTMIGDDPVAAEIYARAWRDRAEGIDRSQAGRCLALAQGEQRRWREAAASFAQAAADAPRAETRFAARLEALAGYALLNAGDSTGALTTLDRAAARFQESDRSELAGDVALARSRALVALGREAEAEAPLALAREAIAHDADAWLLSATLARRLDKLVEAQNFIIQAHARNPRDPAIGLEAGVIAVLSGRENAARRSWESVISLHPGSDEAHTAQSYLDQLATP